jgi:hypothetical protein
MGNELGPEIASRSRVHEARLEELLDRLELQEAGAYGPSEADQGRLEELLDRLETLEGDLPSIDVPSSIGVPIPVIELIQIQYNKQVAQFARGSAGFYECYKEEPIRFVPGSGDFYAFFCGELSSPQVQIAITGKLMAEENGRRRAITAADQKKWQPKDIVNGVYTGGGVSASTSWATKLRNDGSFITESQIVLDAGTRRIRIQVRLDLQGNRQIMADAVLQRDHVQGRVTAAGFDCFLGLMDSYEKRRPVGRVTGSCQVAASHFEFLSSVRKMFQPAPGSPLTKLFDLVLGRNRRICQLADVNSAEGRSIRRYENLKIGKDIVDIGHVLVGIEASRRQKPGAAFLVQSDWLTEAVITWAGDLGSALESYAEATVMGTRVDLHDIEWYLVCKAGSADLLGDIDGLNIGAVYDETRSLSENFRAYYGAKPFLRFHNFLTRTLDDDGRPLFRLASQKPPMIDRSSRLRAINRISFFAYWVAQSRKVLDKMTESQQAQFIDVVVDRDGGSKEMNTVVDYFFAFLERGLAEES